MPILSLKTGAPKQLHFYSSAPANDNLVVNCLIDKADYLFFCDRPNAGNQLINCIITRVDSLDTGDQPVNFTYIYSDFFDNGFVIPAGPGNISAAPLFVDAPSGNYHLQAASPCIDAGTSQNVPPVDFDGQARPAGGGWDIGPYEYSGPLGTGEASASRGAGMRIFPNPASGKVTIESGVCRLSEIRVCNVLGRDFTAQIRARSLCPAAVELGLSALPPGIYFVKAGGFAAPVLKREK